MLAGMVSGPGCMVHVEMEQQNGATEFPTTLDTN